MLMGFAASLAVGLALCLRGSIAQVSKIRFRGLWLIPLALIAQVLIVNVLFDLPEGVARAAHVATYAVAAAFLAVNLQIPGMPILALGTAANAVTIALNGGVLPASAQATAAAGWTADDARFANSLPLDDPRLAWLGDNYATPAWVPFSNVYSLGDVVIVLGIFVIAFRASRLPMTSLRPVPRDASGGRHSAPVASVSNGNAHRSTLARFSAWTVRRGWRTAKMR